MKDFKCLPKMKTGGAVKKYSEGNIVEDYRSAVRSGKNLDPGLTNKSGSDKSFKIDGGEYKVKGVEMPIRESKRKSIPGIEGEYNPTPPKSRDQLALLKKGGKAKRGNKK